MPKFNIEVDVDLDDYLENAEQVREDVRKELIRNIASQVRVGWLVDEAERAAMRKEVNEAITTIVREVVTAEVQSIASGQFTPTNAWGERKGEPTTLREMCANGAKHWFAEQVDANGKTDGYSNPKAPRIQWLVLQQVEATFKAEMAATVEQIKAQIRAGIQTKTAAEISAVVARLLAPGAA